MTNQPVPEPLATTLSTYFDVELFWHSFPELLQKFLASDLEVAKIFKQQFIEAITKDTVSAEQYYRLTGHKFANDVQLIGWLHKLWIEIYGDEILPGWDD
jgi:hypothetical protein